MSNTKRYIYVAQIGGDKQYINEVGEDDWASGLRKHREFTGSDMSLDTCDCGHFEVGKVLAGVGVVTHVYRIDDDRVQICVER